MDETGRETSSGLFRGMAPSEKGMTVVAGNVMMSFVPMEGNGYEYDAAIFHAEADGRLSITYAYRGEVLGFDPFDHDGRDIALAGAFPDGMADEAVIISDIGCPLDDKDEDGIASALGFASARSLCQAIRVATGIGLSVNADEAEPPIGAQSYLLDADGKQIRIGSWVRQGDGGTIHRVVSVAYNRFHGPMVQVDDAIVGIWLCVGDGMHVVERGISTWEQLIDAARLGGVSKGDLVEIAKALASGVGE